MDKCPPYQRRYQPVDDTEYERKGGQRLTDRELLLLLIFGVHLPASFYYLCTARHQQAPGAHWNLLGHISGLPERTPLSQPKVRRGTSWKRCAGFLGGTAIMS